MKGQTYAGKFRGHDVFVVGLSDDIDAYGRGFFRVLKYDGVALPPKQQYSDQIPFQYLKAVHRRPQPRPGMTHRFPNDGCPQCGTSQELGYRPDMRCPNCESFKAWMQQFLQD